MAKLNCYCINSVASKFGILFMLMDKKAYAHMTYEIWSKLRMHIVYAFEDRYDDGYDLNKMIEVFSKTKYRFAYKFLKELKETQFEDHKVTKISSTLLINLMGAKESDKEVYLKRYYVKQFKRIRKLYEQTI